MYCYVYWVVFFYKSIFFVSGLTEMDSHIENIEEDQGNEEKDKDLLKKKIGKDQGKEEYLPYLII